MQVKTLNAMVLCKVMEMVSSQTLRPKDQKGIEKTSNTGDVGVHDIDGESIPFQGKGIISLLNPLIKIRTKIMVKI